MQYPLVTKNYPSSLLFSLRTVAHVELSDHLLNVVFTLFDDNGDGMLSNKYVTMELCNIIFV